MRLTFVETRAFSARWDKRLAQEALRELQNLLLENSAAGNPIPGCGLLRKLRFGDSGRGKGKRGGVRAIHLHTPAAQRIDLITVYGKDESGHLSKSELRELCGLARLLRAEATARARNSPAPSKRKPR